MTRLAELGRIVAEEQNATRARTPADERAAERFARKVSHPRVTVKRTWLAAGALAAAAAVALWLGLHRPGVALAPFAAAPTVGQPVVAHDGQSVPLSFPDGSQVVLASGCEAIVHELSGSGASFEVSRGEASLAVHHQPHTNWQVGAGPYHVRVTGTRFSVAWAPERERFELRLEQGSVVVTTDMGSHAAVTMVAPESLVIDHGGWQLASSASAADAPPAPPAALPSSNEPAAAPATPASQAVPNSPSWEALARAGKYTAAYEEASHHGVMQLADSRSSSSLLSLAEACRFSGHVGEATQVLARLRARFPGTDDAATAAFQLGRFAGDAAAAGFFRTYLQERPNGSLAPEASGRLLEALNRSGDRAGAERAAEAYLARYPNGPHAAFARQLLVR